MEPQTPRPGSPTSVESAVTTTAMPDQTPLPPANPPAPPAAPAGPTIHIGEEYGTAKKNLPPAKIVLIAIAAVLVVVLIASFLKRAKPQASGSLDNVVAVEIPGQTSTMVALTFTLRNTSDKISTSVACRAQSRRPAETSPPTPSLPSISIAIFRPSLR